MPVIAPGNLMFYRGTKTFPQWDGSGFISGLASMSLNRIVFDGKGGAKTAERWNVGKRIRDVGEDLGRNEIERIARNYILYTGWFKEGG